MRSMSYMGFQFRFTRAVKYLLILNTAVFVLDQLFRLRLFPLFGLVPVLFWKGFLWQPVTYMFLHGGFFHILINMLVLWMFGTSLESTWGTRKFLIFYFICGISAGLLNVVVTPGSPVPIVGASGAIYGLLMAFGILFPNQLIYLWGIVPVKAKYFVIGIGVIEFLAAIGSTQSGVAHVAHLGGMLFGFVYMKWDRLTGSFSSRRTEHKRRKYIRVVQDREREKEDIRRKVNELLDKINRHGIDSLSDEEQRIMKELSSKMNEMDRKR